MPIDVGRCIDLMVGAMQRQREQYKALGETARALAQHLEAGGSDAPNLDAILARQVQQAKELERFDGRVAELKRRLGEALQIDEVNLSNVRGALRERGSLAEHEERLRALESIVGETLKFARDVQRVTEANERRLREGLGALKGQLNDVRVGHNVARAYGRVAKGNPVPSKFVDKQR